MRIFAKIEHMLTCDKKIRPLLALLAITQLTACAVISKSECEDNNWQRVGYSAGADGEPDSLMAFNKRADICAKYGLPADISEFEVGYAQGKNDFCEISNAVNLGIRGKRRAIDDQVCTDFRYLGFRAAFNKGYGLYKLKRQLADTRSQIDRFEEEIHRNHRKRRQLAQQIQSGNLSEQQIRSAHHYRNRLSRDNYDARSSIRYYVNRLRGDERAVRKYQTLLDAEFGLEY
jgi:hypothetical protein